MPDIDWPRNPSAKHLYEQMLLWGWKNEGKQGEKLRMTWPPTGDEVLVMQTHLHTKNSGNVIRTIVKLTTGGNYHVFWSRKASIDPPLKENRGMALSVSDPIPDATTEKSKTEPATGRHSGISRRVLIFLIQRGNVGTTLPEISYGCGLENRQQAQNACSHLVKKGLVERPLKGFYKASDKFLALGRIDVQHLDGIVKNALDGNGIPSPLQVHATVTVEKDDESELDASWRHHPASQQQQPHLRVVSDDDITDPWEVDMVRPGDVDREEQTPQVSFPVKQSDIGDIEETMTEILDLMFPTGFKARHIPAIEKWKEATRILIRSVDR